MAKSTALLAMQLLNAADPDTLPFFPRQCLVLYIDQSQISSVAGEKCSTKILCAWLYKILIFQVDASDCATFCLLPEFRQVQETMKCTEKLTISRQVIFL